MKKHSSLFSLFLILTLLLVPTGIVSAQGPQPPTNPGCGLNPFCYLGQAVSAAVDYFTSPTTPVTNPSGSNAVPTTVFIAPTVIPNHISSFVDTMWAYMNAIGRTSEYALKVDSVGNIIFRSNPNQVPVSEQTGPNGRSLTDYLCFDPDTKYLVQSQCNIDPVMGTWTLGSAGYYTDTLQTTSINITDVFFVGYNTKSNEFFYVSTSDYGCKQLNSNSDRTVYLCSQFSQQFNELPTTVAQLPTSAAAMAPISTPVPAPVNLCGSSITSCSWNKDKNEVYLSANGWSMTVTEFIWGGPGTYWNLVWGTISVSSTWPTGDYICKNVYIEQLPEFTNYAGSLSREYGVCISFTRSPE